MPRVKVCIHLVICAAALSGHGRLLVRPHHANAPRTPPGPGPLTRTQREQDTKSHSPSRAPDVCSSTPFVAVALVSSVLIAAAHCGSLRSARGGGASEPEGRSQCLRAVWLRHARAAILARPRCRFHSAVHDARLRLCGGSRWIVAQRCASAASAAPSSCPQTKSPKRLQPFVTTMESEQQPTHCDGGRSGG